MKLQLFFERMKQYLSPEDFALFQESYEQPSYRGIRVNPLRAGAKETLANHGFAFAETPFSGDHYYLKEDISGNHPYHLAGLFYFQEPSAGSAVEVLDVQEGDIVLDLCAAPGGKSTQIAAKLQGNGLLVSNEIVSSRAQILLSNIERMGISNAIITNMHPDVLASKLEEQFDKVLVDAPCSGEGMFRKDPKALEEWSLEHVASCALRQLPILDAGYRALKPGGILVYSTCTFSKEENEEVIASFLASHPDMELADANVSFGRPGLDIPGVSGAKVRRIYPMDGGEGHFVAKLKKQEGTQKQSSKWMRPAQTKDKSLPLAIDFMKQQLHDFDPARIFIHQGMCYYLPELICDLTQLKIVRAGVCIGEIKAGLLRPHHQFYMAFPASRYRKVIALRLGDLRVNEYLKGLEINDASDVEGYCCIQVDGYAIGFGKKNRQTVKNHYPKGLRLY